MPRIQQGSLRVGWESTVPDNLALPVPSPQRVMVWPQVGAQGLAGLTSPAAPSPASAHEAAEPQEWRSPVSHAHALPKKEGCSGRKLPVAYPAESQNLLTCIIPALKSSNLWAHCFQHFLTAFTVLFGRVPGTAYPQRRALATPLHTGIPLAALSPLPSVPGHHTRRLLGCSPASGVELESPRMRPAPPLLRGWCGFMSGLSILDH